MWSPETDFFQSVVMENEENGGGGAAGDGEIPEIELIIRASTIDGRRKGACLFCQVVFPFHFIQNRWWVTLNLQFASTTDLKGKIAD